MFEESLRCLAWGGRLLILGFLGGGPANIRSNYLLIKGLDVDRRAHRRGDRGRSPRSAAPTCRRWSSWPRQGKLQPRISHRFPLERAAEAVQAVIDRKVIGKAVLVS